MQVQDKKFIKRQKIAAKLLDDVSNEKLPMCGAHIISDYDNTEYQCFTNGFVGFMLKQPLPDLRLAEPFNMVKMIGEHEQKQQYYKEDIQEYDLNIKDIKAIIKNQKEKNKNDNTDENAYYEIGNHTYNAQYLLDTIEILGGDIQFKQDESRHTTPGILTSENGKAIIMPLCKRN